MSDQHSVPKHLKHDDRDRQNEIIPNDLGFVPHESLDWPTVGGTYVVRLMSRISGHMAACHPGQPSLYQELVPELNRVSRILPAKTVQRDVYKFMQRITEEAVTLAAKWQALEPYIEPASRAGRTKRPRKARSPAIDAMSRQESRESRQVILEAAAHVPRNRDTLPSGKKS